MTFTNAEDVAVELGRTLASPELAQVQSWIERVEARIEGRLPDLPERMVEPGFERRLIGVVVAAVARKVQNPEGFRSVRIDDFYGDRGALTVGDLWPTAEEWAELDPASSAGAFTFRPTFMPDWPSP